MPFMATRYLIKPFKMVTKNSIWFSAKHTTTLLIIINGEQSGLGVLSCDLKVTV